jgi:hypothetical protein
MFNLVLRGQIEVVKSSTFEGKTSSKVELMNITDKGIMVQVVKLLETEDIKEIKKNTNMEMEVKLFTNDKTKEIYFSQVSPIKYLK